MLFFEFFPMFVALVSAVVVIWLFIANRTAQNDPNEPRLHKVEPPREPGATDEERGARRPSMSA